MEIELKYTIKDKETAERIWTDEYLSSVGDISSRENLIMKAVYFDTEDRILSSNNMAFRVRLEGESTFAALKWGGHSSNGFHEREEITVPVSGEAFISPKADIFSLTEEGKALLEFLGDKVLVNLLETRYLRRRMRLDIAGTIIELAIDTGKIITDAGEEDIMELELELYAGDIQEVLTLGKKLEAEYELVPEDRSKLARGLAHLRENRG